MATKRTFGIDVSYHQGTIDWNAVKAAGVDFAVIRGGYGVGNVDTQFVRNIEGAIDADIENIGVYWFSYAYNATRARSEVDLCLRTIEPYREHINMPVWFDWEEASYSYVKSSQGVSLTASQIQTIARAWCNAITAAGYETGIYSNKSNSDGWFKLSNGKYLWEDLNCQFWYARYGANNEKSLFITPAYEATALSEHPETDIFQYSDVGRVAGIASSGVDLNVRYAEIAEEEAEDPIPTPTTPGVTEPIFVPQVESARPTIDFVEIRNEEGEVISIIDTAKSIIWHSVYFGVGDFEIYIPATSETFDALKIGRYVTRSDNNEVGVIESISISDNQQDGRMIVASGRFAKSILDRRVIYNLSGTSNRATVLSGDVELEIQKVVSDNAIASSDKARNIDILALGAVSGSGKHIVDESGALAAKQVAAENLMTYTDSVLEEYGLASTCIFSDSKLRYVIYQGIDRSIDNVDGNEPIIFSREYDNLTASEYSFNSTTEKNVALIGGEGEGVERFYTLLAGAAQGLQRREVWIDASSIKKTYKDDSDTEKTLTDAEYKATLNAKGKQDMSAMLAEETFSGTIDITRGNWVYNRDFTLGDIVTVQEDDLGIYANVRIREITEVQDENGYTVEAKYQ